MVRSIYTRAQREAISRAIIESLTADYSSKCTEEEMDMFDFADGQRYYRDDASDFELKSAAETWNVDIDSIKQLV